jgi:hypothetical protein
MEAQSHNTIRNSSFNEKATTIFDGFAANTNDILQHG